MKVRCDWYTVDVCESESTPTQSLLIILRRHHPERWENVLNLQEQLMPFLVEPGLAARPKVRSFWRAIDSKYSRNTGNLIMIAVWSWG